MSEPFWKAKALSELSAEEWESLCDACGRCCLQKLEHEWDGTLYYTSVACRHLDTESCSCVRYEERVTLPEQCVQLTPENVHQLTWMPTTCAYRILASGGELPEWHPLVSGNPESVHEAGISVRSYAISESQLDDPDDLEPFVMGRAL